MEFLIILIIRNMEFLIIAKNWGMDVRKWVPYIILQVEHCSSATPKSSVKACKSLHMQKMEDIHKNMARWTEQLLVGWL